MKTKEIIKNCESANILDNDSQSYYLYCDTFEFITYEEFKWAQKYITWNLQKARPTT